MIPWQVACAGGRFTICVGELDDNITPSLSFALGESLESRSGQMVLIKATFVVDLEPLFAIKIGILLEVWGHHSGRDGM